MFKAEPVKPVIAANENKTHFVFTHGDDASFNATKKPNIPYEASKQELTSHGNVILRTTPWSIKTR